MGVRLRDCMCLPLVHVPNNTECGDIIHNKIDDDDDDDEAHGYTWIERRGEHGRRFTFKPYQKALTNKSVCKRKEHDGAVDEIAAVASHSDEKSLPTSMGIIYSTAMLQATCWTWRVCAYRNIVIR